jgi:hypothetical protein
MRFLNFLNSKDFLNSPAIILTGICELPQIYGGLFEYLPPISYRTHIFDANAAGFVPFHLRIQTTSQSLKCHVLRLLTFKIWEI